MWSIRIAVAQAGVTSIYMAIAYSNMGEHAAKAAAYGGLVAVANTLMLAWRMRAGAHSVTKSPGQELAGLVRSSMERFFMVALLIGAGLGWLKLLPAPLLLSFVLGQVVLVVSTIISGIEKQ